MIKLFTLNEEAEEARAYFLEALEPHTFTASDGTVLPFRLYLPDHFDPNRRYPLMVHLHGSGIRGNDNKFQLYHDLRKTQMLFAHQFIEPFLFVIPQCPEDTAWGEHFMKNWDFVQDRSETKDPAGYLAMDAIPENSVTRAVYEMTQDLIERYGADRDRIYLSGFSMGGCGTYEMLYRHPGLFAAALLGCAYSDPAIAPAIADVPMYILHGIEDTCIPISYGRAMNEALAKAGADFIYREVPDRGHALDAVPESAAEFEEGMRFVFAKRLSEQAAKV